MQGARGGYTIVEVIIVLAISGALFAAAVTVFGGKQGRTQFAQAMQDVDSQIRSFVNDVSVSIYPEADQYTCDTTGMGGKPVLTYNPNAVGESGNCIFLGKALKVDLNPAPGKIYIYSVLGSRSAASTSLTSSNPSPAEVNGALLYQTYDIGASSIIRWAKTSPTLAVPPLSQSDTRLTGFYNNLQNTSTSSKQSLLSYGYASPAIINGATNGVKNAIQNSTGLTAFQSWHLCIASGSSSQFAQLAVSLSAAGVNTKITYVNNC